MTNSSITIKWIRLCLSEILYRRTREFNYTDRSENHSQIFKLHGNLHKSEVIWNESTLYDVSRICSLLIYQIWHVDYQQNVLSCSHHR